MNAALGLEQRRAACAAIVDSFEANNVVSYDDRFDMLVVLVAGLIAGPIAEHDDEVNELVVFMTRCRMLMDRIGEVISESKTATKQ